MTEHLTPAETRRILLGITNPAEDVERRAIEAGILRRNWRDIAARKEAPAEPEPVYGMCTACGSVEVRLVRATGTRDLSGIGEHEAYPTGYGCELCS